jgi:hypothetical protein
VKEARARYTALRWPWKSKPPARTAADA